MPAGQFKDHYRTLEITASATQDEVKKAYRALAFKYHPDTNPDNLYAAAHFIEIQEAYAILIDEAKRHKYDEERWLNGMSDRARDQVIVTPAWIHKEAYRLSRHMATVDTYRMSHSALYDYVKMLLQDSYMAVLLQTNDASMNAAIVQELLQSTRHLKYIYMLPVSVLMVKLVPADNDVLIAIHTQVRASYRQYLWHKYQPLVIALVTVTLCILMFIYSKR